ncbi:ABC transporter permease [Uliginosibacterium sp. 31-12]|uniref:ABC transporter permease n=1 Tax=Uliginosibacterium sp. 31-12 TaxID=3062781 RepID=UPI0026E2F54E|nr:FtsX-like permease family protein [Uliginosibacterium sp. 31-12]MDO6384844.1 FtsX-like permease family protein [Uliginosibacterium sp. 31-12]
MSSLRLALQMLRRDLRAGELSLLGMALLLAVASLTSVGFLTDRVRQALDQNATQLLGGDLLISADREIPPGFLQEAQRRGLQSTRTITFNSMATSEEGAQMVAVKAVEAGYPLRGELRVGDFSGAPAKQARSAVLPGEAWVDEALLPALQKQPGDVFQLGYAKLKIAARVEFESDRGVGFSSFAPRVLINAADLPASGLLVEGSRARYRLLVAGEREAVRSYEKWLTPLLERGQQIESLDNARPEIRANLDRAGRFLRMAAMLAVVLAAVAIGLSARRYLDRHLDGCAVMRCFGAQRGQLLSLYMGEFLLFGFFVAVAGCLLGYGVQAALGGLAAALVQSELPAPGLVPVAQGLAIGVLLMAGFVAPQLLRLTAVPPIRAIRREWGQLGGGSIAAWAFGALALAGLMLWIAGEWKLGGIVVGGFAAALALFAALAWGLLALFGRARHAAGGQGRWGLRYGLAALYRRRTSSVIQVVALALGLTAILLLTLISNDLLAGWRAKQPADAPNRFIIGIQPEQRQPIADFLAAHEIAVPLQPMIRGRLVAINDHAVKGSDYEEERTRNLAEREFNLSFGSELQAGNRVIAGAWHGAQQAPLFSMEEGIGKRLGVKLGDNVTFDIAGQRVTGKVSSVRKLDWDSMRVNFFFTAAPGLLDKMPASYITSFHLPADKAPLVRELVAQYPNITVIDVAMVLEQVASLTERLAQVVRFVFSFALAAGILVLLAAQRNTHDERGYEVSVLRALGARRHQVRSALLAEFAALGVIAALLAVGASTAIGYLLAEYALELDFQPSVAALSGAGLLAVLTIVVFGWLGVRRLLAQTVIEGIRETT